MWEEMSPSSTVSLTIMFQAWRLKHHSDQSGNKLPRGQYYKHIKIVNDALESSVSDATIWNVTLESLITILEASFSLIDDVNSTGVNYDNRQLTIIICL